MKKTAILLVLLTSAAISNAQEKPVTLTRQQGVQVVQSLQRGLQLIHRLDISALKRDSLDLFIGSVYQFIDERNKAAKADTVKVKGAKPVKS